VVGLSPRLIGVNPIESDAVQIPRIVRNQGLRTGSTYAGQALSTAGGAVTSSGAAARAKSHSKVRRYESVKKSELIAKGGKPERGVSYLPEADRKANRWHEKRLARKAKPMGRPGLIRIRMGSSMMVAGRLLPVLAVGYIAYQYLPDSQKEVASDAEFFGPSLHERGEYFAAAGFDAYRAAHLGFSIGKGLLGVFS